MTRELSQLRRLARLHGVQIAYYDVEHRRQTAGPESLLAVLGAMGIAVDAMSEIPEHIREREAADLARGLEPVIVVWDEQPTTIQLVVPADSLGRRLQGTLELESGETRQIEWGPKQRKFNQAGGASGSSGATLSLTLPKGTPSGYHRLTIDAPHRQCSALVISAPQRTYQRHGGGAPSKIWGVFAPLYAIQTAHSWGAGTYSDLAALADWSSELGASMLATLPLLPAFLENSEGLYDPSPYAPVSRLFWNEFYIDVTAIPELSECPAARELVANSNTRAEINALRALKMVDYRRVMQLKRRVLDILSADFFRRRPPHFARYQKYLKQYPLIDDYARFRAVCERQKRYWGAWPEPMREGIITDGDFDASIRDFYLYAQWTAHEQVAAVAGRHQSSQVALYLDLPLGVSRDGYDVWRNRRAFSAAVSVGSPPDPFFSKGQNWGFAPLHPETIREQGYAYVIQLIRHHLQFGGMLRIDHIMGLHRLYWIPEGADARHGVFVHYHAEELYAILSLESHRHQAALVGENLGTVPDYVNTAMKRHQIRQMYVVQYELEPERNSAVGTVARNCVASLNTHDMPTFAAFWRGLDIEDRQQLGLLDRQGARAEQNFRNRLRELLVDWLRSQKLVKTKKPDLQTVMRRTLDFLADSPAEAVIVSLEDLWMETQPQNVPGTSTERPNWLRMARYSLEELQTLPEVVEALESVAARRTAPPARTTTTDGQSKGRPRRSHAATTVAVPNAAAPRKQKRKTKDG